MARTKRLGPRRKAGRVPRLSLGTGGGSGLLDVHERSAARERQVLESDLQWSDQFQSALRDGRQDASLPPGGRGGSTKICVAHGLFGPPRRRFPVLAEQCCAATVRAQ